MTAPFGIFTAALVASLFLALILPTEGVALPEDSKAQQQAAAAAIPFEDNQDQIPDMMMGQLAQTPFNPEAAASQLRRIKRQSCSAGRVACILSCKWQDCDTGYCINGTCTCRRCD